MTEEKFSRRFELLKSIAMMIIASGFVVFGWGVLWQKSSDFVDRVAKQGDRLSVVEGQIKDLKNNLGDLGAAPYEMEVSSDDSAGICELGGVVTGIIRDNERILVRCASIGRAAWNPNPFTPGSIDPNVYLIRSARSHRPDAITQTPPPLQVLERQPGSTPK
jgi:hypothetical protein